jgi:glucose-6-phosphate 1-dehydrogenase
MGICDYGTAAAAAMVATTNSGRKALPATMTIFGGAGDPTKRLLVPALYNLVRTGKLPDGFVIISVHVADQATEGWRHSLTEMMDAFAWVGRAIRSCGGSPAARRRR